MERARRTVLRSVPSLWLIGVCVFLPMVRACEKIESPATLVAKSPWPNAPVAAPLFVAELLAVVAIVALARGRAGRVVERLTLAAVALASPASLFFAAAIVMSHRTDEQLVGVAGALAFAGGALLVVRALRVDGWRRLRRLHAAYTVLALPTAGLIALVSVGDGPRDTGIGAWLYLGAMAALAGVQLAGLFARREIVADSSA